MSEPGAPPPHAAPAAARIAVIVPCFNDGPLVPEALASLVEPEPLEVLVVDDASRDPATVVALAKLAGQGVRVVRHEHNQGLPPARMTGLRATRAPYVFPLDADDLAVPGALSAMADLLDARPDVAVCFGDYAEFGTHERVRRVPARLDPFRVAYRNDYPVSSLFRRSALEAVGGWQAVGGAVGYEDWNLWMSLAEAGHAGAHWGRGVALRRRLHGERMLTDAAGRHVALYDTLRRTHPRLFSDLASHRRTTDLARPARWIYPILYGRRPPLGLRTRLDEVLRAARSLSAQEQ
jgi:glycosyltransferase involved in cell wall biosynthesis